MLHFLEWCDAKLKPHLAVPFTFWAHTTESCRCDYRLSVFKLLIDDYIKFFNYEEFDVIWGNINFERVFSQIPDAYIVLQQDHDL